MFLLIFILIYILFTYTEVNIATGQMPSFFQTLSLDILYMLMSTLGFVEFLKLPKICRHLRAITEECFERNLYEDDSPVKQRYRFTRIPCGVSTIPRFYFTVIPRGTPMSENDLLRIERRQINKINDRGLYMYHHMSMAYWELNNTENGYSVPAGEHLVRQVEGKSRFDIRRTLDSLQGNGRLRR
jgi:hypothetical protein